MAVNTNYGGRCNPIASMQMSLNDRYHTGLAVDGQNGPQLQNTLADLFQRDMGMTYTFQNGENSNLVYLLQAALYLGGYNLYLNGVYDAATQAAVRAFQRGHGMAETGLADPAMLRLLFPAPAAQPMGPIPAPAPRPAPPVSVTPLAQPMGAPRAAAAMPARAPAPAPNFSPNSPSRPGRPAEYTVMLSPRSPEAVIRVKYGR